MQLLPALMLLQSLSLKRSKSSMLPRSRLLSTPSAAQDPSPTSTDPPDPWQQSRRKKRVVHHVSVCIVPPTEVWENVTRCRRELRDPGFFRWPPHINLLYPFFDFPIDSNPCDNGDNPSGDTHDPTSGDLQEIIDTLERICRQCKPFDVQLAHFGTFGNKQRGVLWLDPTVVVSTNDTADSPPLEEDPLLSLQSRLAGAFTAPDEQATSNSRSFRPHLTVGHFSTIDAARQTQSNVEDWWSALTFPVDRIRLLHRASAGQFLRVADIPLGPSMTTTTQLHMPPVPFSGMPIQEDAWVAQARQDLQKNRKKGRRRKR